MKGISMRYIYCVIIGILAAVPTAFAATPQWVIDGLLIEHPGRIQVEYLGQFQQDPPRYRVNFNGRAFTMFEGTIGPDFHSAQLWEHAKINPGDRVLEVGTGIGCLSIFAAETASKVVATDIEPIAVENTKFNAEQHGVGHIVDARQGDLFGPISPNEQFDVIFFNIIYPYNQETLHFWRLHERFFAEVGQFLAKGGRIYYQAGYFDNLGHIREMASANNFEIMEMNMWAVLRYHRQPMVFMLQRQSDI